MPENEVPQFHTSEEHETPATMDRRQFLQRSVGAVAGAAMAQVAGGQELASNTTDAKKTGLDSAKRLPSGNPQESLSSRRQEVVGLSQRNPFLQIQMKQGSIPDMSASINRHPLSAHERAVGFTALAEIAKPSDMPMLIQKLAIEGGLTVDLLPQVVAGYKFQLGRKPVRPTKSAGITKADFDTQLAEYTSKLQKFEAAKRDYEHIVFDAALASGNPKVLQALAECPYAKDFVKREYVGTNGKSAFAQGLRTDQDLLNAWTSAPPDKAKTNVTAVAYFHACRNDGWSVLQTLSEGTLKGQSEKAMRAASSFDSAALQKCIGEWKNFTTSTGGKDARVQVVVAVVVAYLEERLRRSQDDKAFTDMTPQLAFERVAAALQNAPTVIPTAVSEPEKEAVPASPESGDLLSDWKRNLVKIRPEGVEAETGRVFSGNRLFAAGALLNVKDPAAVPQLSEIGFTWSKRGAEHGGMAIVVQVHGGQVEFRMDNIPGGSNSSAIMKGKGGKPLQLLQPGCQYIFQAQTSYPGSHIRVQGTLLMIRDDQRIPVAEGVISAAGAMALQRDPLFTTEDFTSSDPSKKVPKTESKMPHYGVFVAGGDAQLNQWTVRPVSKNSPTNVASTRR